MYRWSEVSTLPSLLCLLSRLPREVRKTTSNAAVELTNFRVMIVTIRDYGLYPCSRCTIPKDHIFKIGTEEDHRDRNLLRRVDTIERQGRVDQARRELYENGYALSNKRVDGALKQDSLVPTRVRRSQFSHPSVSSICVRMHFRRACSGLALTSSPC